jgi:serine/threonine protein kinase
MPEDDARGHGRDATMAAAIAVGSEFAGYRIHSLLGRGATGSVYLADDLRLKRKVALKVLAPEREHKAAFRERFLRDSQLAGSLRHANVIPIYEAGASGGLLYIAMRYIEGSDLRRLLTDGPLPPERAIGLTAQIAAALDAAHERGLVHRDVKPSNVLIDSSGHAFLTDFGVMRRVHEGSSGEDGPSETVDYVAPEQIQDAEVDGRADTYALGCVLHECLLGKAPFAQDSVVLTLFDHLETDPPRPRGLEQVIPKALAKDPAERYTSGTELVEAARRALGLNGQSCSSRCSRCCS